MPMCRYAGMQAVVLRSGSSLATMEMVGSLPRKLNCAWNRGKLASCGLTNLVGSGNHTTHIPQLYISLYVHVHCTTS